MKKIFLTFLLFCSTFALSQERPFQAFFGINTDNPLAVVEAMDEYAASNCPQTTGIRLMNEFFNGYDDTTHTIIVTYPNKMAYMAWANNFASCPAAAKFLQKMNSISESTFQTLGMPLLTGGDPSEDQVFQIFIMNVSDPAAYANAYSKLMNTEGQCPSSWGLVAMGPGVEPSESGTHFAYCGYKSLDSYLDGYMNQGNPTREYETFLRKAPSFRDLLRVNMNAVVKDWTPGQ